MGITAIIRKDLLILLRDRRAVTILLVMPLVFIAILGISTGQLLGWKSENAILSMAVVNESGDALADDLIASLGKQKGISVQVAGDVRQAYKAIDDGDQLVGVVIGPAFRQRVDELQLSDFLDPEKGRLAAGPKAMDISLYARPTQTALARITEQLVLGVAVQTIVPVVAKDDRLVQMYLKVAAATATSPAGDAGGTSVDWAPEREADEEEVVTAGNLAYQFIVPAYTVLFAFFLIAMMARSFVVEASQGTLRRLRAAPVSSFSVLVGKTVPFFIISLIQAVVLFLSGKLLFGMSWGTMPWLLVPVIVCTSMAATGLGLLTALVIRTEAQVSAYANLMVLALGGLSGCFMPREWLPEIMRRVSLAIPHAWALIAYDQLLNSGHPSTSRVLLCCVMLVAFSAIFVTLGWFRYRRVAGRWF